MNVFTIPSWYPHRCWPLEGIFLREQAIAIGELRTQWKVANSLWGQGLGRISLAHLRRSPWCVLDAMRSRRFDRQIASNVWEFHTPALSWSEAFLHGNRAAILAANRENLARAMRLMGRFDLLHAHVSYPAGWVAMQLHRETGIPFVITEHMGPFPLQVYASRDGSLRPFIREPLERAHGLVAVSPALCDRIASFGISKPEYVPNLVDERLYTVETHRDRERFVFFTLGQMELVKGIPDLLHAIRLFLDGLTERDRARVTFRLAGTGHHIDDFKALGRRLAVDAWLEWPGFLTRDEARAGFRECDALVLASHHESFGVVVVEAIASGKPVVATRSGGPEATVKPENGLLVPPGDPGTLAGALRTMYASARDYDPEVIRAGFLREFSRSGVVDRLEPIYGRAILAGRGRVREPGVGSGLGEPAQT
jgi:glycosyltransferase involved in cell wall biosynthesis